jgi:hypothetical protein
MHWTLPDKWMKLRNEDQKRVDSFLFLDPFHAVIARYGNCFFWGILMKE